MATTIQVRKFENTLDLIKNFNLAAYDYLKAIGMEKWTLAYDHRHRYWAMTTNLSECFNGVFKGAHSLPIIAMVKFTCYKVNSYFDDRRNKTLEQWKKGKNGANMPMTSLRQIKRRRSSISLEG